MAPGSAEAQDVAAVAPFFVSRCAGMTTVNAVAFDDPSIFKPMMTVYARRRRAWDDLAAGIPAFDAMPPAP